MGIREYDHDDLEMSGEIRRIALQKNEEELDRICKKYCLCIGWFLVLILFCWIVYLYLFKL